MCISNKFPVLMLQFQEHPLDSRPCRGQRLNQGWSPSGLLGSDKVVNEISVSTGWQEIGKHKDKLQKH